MAIIVMLISSAIPLIYFRKKGWIEFGLFWWGEAIT
jgi:hypothetical protein